MDAGADDYLGKPFDPQELLARIRALLRRSHQPSTPILTWGDLHLDPVSTTVTYSDNLVPVTPKEYALLELFLRNSKRVFSCDAILDHLWSYGGTPSEEAIRTHIKGLRYKLKHAGAAADLIETVYGIGYRLKPVNSLEVNLLTDTWEKFKGQVLEQVAVLERLSIRFLNRDLQSDWQEVGRSIAHSLSGSLGMFGFSLSSELARQIEKLLGGRQELTIEQGQWLYSMVGALQEELERPVSLPDLYYFDPTPAIDILLVSVDPDLEREIQSLVDERKWHIQVVPTIAAAKSQLQHHLTRSILLSPDLAQQTEEVVRLLVEVGKHVPAIPVILLTDAPGLHPEIERFGTCTSICPNSPSEIILEIERSIAQVESTQTHILVVDDDLKILAILRALLVPWGFRVTTLSDPQKFWEIVPVAKPDLLILDVEMPTINGLELCKSVRDRADWSHLPIIFLTARTEPTLIQQVFAIGADDFVNKPVVGPEIIARITNLMERQQVKRLRAAERLNLDREQRKITPDRAEFSNQTEIQVESIAIQQLLQAENERHAKTIAEICDRLDLLHQLFVRIQV
ncbi:response regulator [Chamaesiphon minutus]|uniref:Response regulator with CheY-like receiver domain and winged-helix DNA-binding domain n=1 Tax=Chamaesiphon minutus (strain ATCC 27169 / PCC 6605) TaxID=1173020 RepID=K9UDL1_CHAP6|nr:response regulator [Chamaesiphon minutus]AFY92516.1 response regulator with CheY-like receiver domain and winged-helix DNA-binding domain [Chamaesiphon minutus PCC 6605]